MKRTETGPVEDELWTKERDPGMPQARMRARASPADITGKEPKYSIQVSTGILIGPT